MNEAAREEEDEGKGGNENNLEISPIVFIQCLNCTKLSARSNHEQFEIVLRNFSRVFKTVQAVQYSTIGWFTPRILYVVTEFSATLATLPSRLFALSVYLFICIWAVD